MSIKRIAIAFFVILLFVGIVVVARVKDSPKIYYFYSETCPHCIKVEEFFQKEGLYDRYPLEKKEISNRGNAVLFTSLMNRFGVVEKERGIPTVVIGDKVMIGDELIIENFVTEADKWLKETEAKKQAD